jgi:hypothetical protein
VDQMLNIVLQYGFPGVCILVLAWQYNKKDGQCSKLQEDRIAESRAAVAALNNNTAAMQQLTELIKAK